MNGVAAPKRYPHKLSWLVFIWLLVFAFIFITRTAGELPAAVASHFDAAGRPSAFMPRNAYFVFTLLLAVGLPVALVGVLSAVYSRSADLKLPNRDYWLAPQRQERTRAFLAAHAVWFGSLLVALVCFIHWLELDANRQQPPLLASRKFISGIIAFMLCTGAWIGTLLFALRRPGGRKPV